MLKISILIAHYNNAHFFKDCYQSIINQTYQDFEVIILDDGSNKNEVVFVKELIKNDARFIFYQNETNKGVGYTKGKLIELASGDICGFVDPDDTIESNALEIMIKAHLKYPNASIINSNLNFCDQNLNVKSQSNIHQIEQDQKDYFNFKGNISHFATLKKSFYKLTAGIDSYFRIAEDQDLYLKLYEVGESIQIEDVLYNYRLNPSSLTNASKADISIYWHWVAAIKAAERRGINIEDLFVENFKSRDVFDKNQKKINLLKKSKWLKLGYKLGLFKAYKYL